MKRVLLAILLLAGTLPLAAQPNEIGAFVSLPRFSSPTVFNDGLLEVDAEYEEDLGYGVSYARYFSDRFSAELTAQRMSADAILTFEELDAEINVGSFDLTVLTGTAQFHFARGSRVSPYVGAGLAFITGEVEVPADLPAGGDPDATETFDIESSTSLLANAGINIRITPAVALALDAKYIEYEARVEGEGNQSDSLDPFVWSAGVKFRF
jgi:outer membrane protein W